MLNLHYFLLLNTFPKLDVIMDIYRIYPKQARIIFVQFQEPKAFIQTGRRGSFKSTSKPFFVSEFKASGSASYFHWICFPVCKDGHKATLLFESQSPVPAEPHLTQLFVFTMFFQNLTPCSSCSDLTW